LGAMGILRNAARWQRAAKYVNGRPCRTSRE